MASKSKPIVKKKIQQPQAEEKEILEVEENCDAENIDKEESNKDA